MEIKFSISTLLENNISKQNIDFVCRVYGGNSEVIKILMDAMAENIQPKAWRAAWILEHLTTDNPDLLFPHLNSIYHLLNNQNHAGMKRQLFNLILRYKLDEKFTGILFNKAIHWLENPTEAIAVRANAVRFLMKVQDTEPELKLELLEIMKLQLLNNPSPGLKNVLQKAIAKLEK